MARAWLLALPVASLLLSVGCHLIVSLDDLTVGGDAGLASPDAEFRAGDASDGGSSSDAAGTSDSGGALDGSVAVDGGMESDGGEHDGGAWPDGGSQPQPIHQYSLNRSYADDMGGPSAEGHGGSFDDALGYVFEAQKGLSIKGALPQSVYTVDLEFAFSSIAGWSKIMDLEGLSQDRGLYVWSRAIQYVIVPGDDFLTGPANLTENKKVRLTMTRDASDWVVAYLDGVPLKAERTQGPPSNPTQPWAFQDSGKVATLTGDTVTFFIDDTSTGGGESSSGSVRRIRIYGVALTADQVAAAQ